MLPLNLNSNNSVTISVNSAQVTLSLFNYLRQLSSQHFYKVLNLCSIKPRYIYTYITSNSNVNDDDNSDDNKQEDDEY